MISYADGVGMRRRGYTAASIRRFEMVGVSRSDGTAMFRC